MKAGGRREVEIKLRIADIGALRRRLKQLRARKLGRVHEVNSLFDTPQRHLARRGELLRLRLNNGRGVLTYKHPAGKPARTGKRPRPGRGRYKIRQELEVPVANPRAVRAVFAAGGLEVFFRYEKRRTSYRLPGLPNLHLELDETPLGVFVELEGPPRAIDGAARLLGYAPRDYITANYLVLYREHCRRHGITPGDMLFSLLSHRTVQGLQKKFRKTSVLH